MAIVVEIEDIEEPEEAEETKSADGFLRNKHQEFFKEFDEIQSTVRDERLQCLEDRRFCTIPGAQWEGDLGDQFENKPKFEVNKIHLSVMRIINEYRNNRITVDFVSGNGKNDDLADFCDGLYRADEQESVADEAYDNCFEEGVTGGFGAFQLRHDYEDEEDEDSFYQKIYIEPIYDADSSVFYDLQAKRQDKADAKRCYKLTSITKSEYKNKYGEYPTSLEKVIQKSQFDWSTPDVIYLASVYEIEEHYEVIEQWEGLDGKVERYKKDVLDQKKVDELKAIGGRKLNEKRVKRKRVHKYIMSGSRIEEDCGLIAGNCIPIIPYYGKRWFVDNVERCMGHVRLAKDSQRLKNMQISKLGEISAYSSVEKPILTPEQVAGHQNMWSEDNIRNYPYLLVNPITDQNGNSVSSGPIGYTRPPSIPQALAALLQLTEDDMQDLLGNQQAGEQLEGNISTETAHLIQNKLDMQTFIYLSNFAKSIKRCGEVWLGMARDIYVEEGRKLKKVGIQGDVEHVELMQRSVDENDNIILKNDLSKAKFNVTVEVGPSSSTKRAATVRALTNMAKITDDPATREVLSSMALMNMEGEGISDVRNYFRKKLIRMGVVTPTEKEQKEFEEELRNSKENAQDEYLRAAAAAETTKAANNQADTLLKQAKTDDTRAKTAETLINTDIKQGEQAMQIIEKLGPRVVPPSVPGSPVE